MLPINVNNNLHSESQGCANENQMNKKENGFRLFEDLEKELTDDFGNWEVKDDGEIVYNGKGIAYKGISRDALKSFTTLTDMFKKFKPEDSKDALDFYFAYITALRNAGYKSLTINLNNSHITIVE